MASPRPTAAPAPSPPGPTVPEMVRRAPMPGLRPYVQGLAGYTERPPAPLRRREVPAPSVVVIVNLADPLRVLDPRDGGALQAARAFVAGLQDRYVLTEAAGLSQGVQVNLTPPGARLLFGAPMDELANRVVDLADLLGSAADGLVERLQAAPTWESRFAAVEAFIAARIQAVPHPPAGVLRAWRRLYDTHGRTGIGALAAELGWSRKHLWPSSGARWACRPRRWPASSASTGPAASSSRPAGRTSPRWPTCAATTTRPTSSGTSGSSPAVPPPSSAGAGCPTSTASPGSRPRAGNIFPRHGCPGGRRLGSPHRRP